MSNMMKGSYLICLMVVIVLEAAAKPIVSSKLVVALNCGSKDEVVDSHDKVFQYKGDESYVSGNSVPVDYNSNEAAKEADILYTFQKKLYMYERHTYNQMTYTLPVRTGKHTIVLKFAEMYFTAPGQRVFNIKIGSKIVRKDFDVIQRSGQKYAAHEQYIEVDVQSDGVYHEGAKIPGGIANNKLKLVFAKGKADNPIVQGIIVYQDSIENSPEAEFKYLRSTWDKQKQMQKAVKEEEKLKEIIAIQKKKEKTMIRNDQIIVEKTEEVTQATTQQKYGLLRRILMGPLGILGWSALFAAAIYFLYTFVFLMGGQKAKVEASAN